MDNFKLKIVTGMSGAGKTQLMNFFEDKGYYCIDNLPITAALDVIQSLVKVNKFENLVISINANGYFDAGDFESLLERLAKKQLGWEIIFLDAADEVLVRRYKETRRRHPWGDAGGVLEGIKEERKHLEKIRKYAQYIVDTSHFSRRQFLDHAKQIFADEEGEKILVTLMSFGYKYGVPLDADLVMDVRFIPNPFYVENMRFLTGNDEEVREYVLGNDITKDFLAKYLLLIHFLLPHYVKEGKNHLIIAIGCTGGQHRSVAITNHLGLALESDYKIFITHRDLAKANVKPYEK